LAYVASFQMHWIPYASVLEQSPLSLVSHAITGNQNYMHFGIRVMSSK